MLDFKKIKGISLDLDDTLWAIGPTIARAERVLADWMAVHCPMTSAMFANADAMRDIREHLLNLRPELKHDLSAVRREAIRVAMYRAGDDPLRAEAAFSVFFEARNQVVFFDDALPALERLAARFPIVALSNGNADVARVGIDRFFRAAVSARALGVGKPHPDAFHAASQALGLSNERMLHVGDDMALDVLGAMSAGMQAALVNRNPWDELLAVPPYLLTRNLLELCDRLGA